MRFQRGDFRPLRYQYVQGPGAYDRAYALAAAQPAGGLAEVKSLAGDTIVLLRQEGSIAVPSVLPLGYIDFARVADGGHGVIAEVVDGTHLRLEAPSKSYTYALTWAEADTSTITIDGVAVTYTGAAGDDTAERHAIGMAAALAAALPTYVVSRSGAVVTVARVGSSFASTSVASTTAGDGTCTEAVVSAATHTMGTSGLLDGKIWDISGAAQLGDLRSWTRTKNTLTIDDTTGMAAGDLVLVEGVSELSIGASTANLPLQAGARAWFDGVGLYSIGEVLFGVLPTYRRAAISLDLASYVALANENDAITIGWRQGAARGNLGFGVASLDSKIHHGSAPSTWNSSELVGTQITLGMSWYYHNNAGGGTDAFAGGGSYSSNLGASVAFLAASYTTAKASLLSTLGCTVSRARYAALAA